MGFAELKGKQLSLPAVELYWFAMQDWNLTDFRVAAGRLLKTCEFMPTPKDFEDLRQAGRMTAGEAWDIAVKHCSSSEYRKGPTGIALVDQCARILGGYAAIASQEVDRLQWLEKRFCEHYETIQESTETREALPQVTQSLSLRLPPGLKRIGAPS